MVVTAGRDAECVVSPSVRMILVRVDFAAEAARIDRDAREHGCAPDEMDRSPWRGESGAAHASARRTRPRRLPHMRLALIVCAVLLTAALSPFVSAEEGQVRLVRGVFRTN